MPDSNNPKFPSTFQQVRENMKDIDKLLEQFGDLTELPMTIEELMQSFQTMKESVEKIEQIVIESPEGGDIITTDEGVKIIGTHLNTGTLTVNTLIAEYKQGVTFELKDTTVIGLKGKEGCTGDVCAVMTVKKDSSLDGEPENVGFTGFQIAYGTDGLYMFRRDALADGTWGDWQEQKKIPDPVEPTESRQQFVESETEPTDQLAGEYWCEPLE